jgi:hypothetical protein
MIWLWPKTADKGYIQYTIENHPQDIHYPVYQIGLPSGYVHLIPFDDDPERDPDYTRHE